MLKGVAVRRQISGIVDYRGGECRVEYGSTFHKYEFINRICKLCATNYYNADF